MAAVMPDAGTEFGGRVARRLREEKVAWLTVVDGGGPPHPPPNRVRRVGEKARG